MATAKKFVCTNCKTQTARWAGQCSSCDEWGTLEESTGSPIPSSAGVKTKATARKPTHAAKNISAIGEESFERNQTHINEFDRVLGGGIVPGGVMLLAGEPGVGKALALDTLLKTPTGWTTMGAVRVGDTLLDEYSRPTKVVATTEIMSTRPCYDVVFSNGQKITADAEHQWKVLINNTTRVVTTIALVRYLEADATIEVISAPGVEQYDSQKFEFETDRTASQILKDILSSYANERYTNEALSQSLDDRRTFFGVLLGYFASTRQALHAGVFSFGMPLFLKPFLSTLSASIGLLPYYRRNGIESDDIFVSIHLDSLFVKGKHSPRSISVERVTPVASVLVRCVQVDNSTKTYLAGELLVVTHNSTLLLEVANKVAEQGKTVLITSGEESEKQIAMRAKRIGATSENLYVAAESTLEAVLGQIEDVVPDLLIVDSIQTIASEGLEGRAGERAQVTEVSTILTRWAKSNNIPLILVGHVTKEGTIAGPRTIEHLVDVVMHFEGDKDSSLRMLRGIKNRFGASDEVGCFEHADNGILEVSDPSGILLGSRTENISGVVASMVIEGQRALPIEIQSLVHASHIPVPRKATSGLDNARTIMLQAALEKHGRIRISDKDVYVSTVAGIRTKEPGVDLACMMAIASAALDIALPPNLLALGEVSLSGEIRKVPNMKKRVDEAKRLGFKRLFIPANALTPQQIPSGLIVVTVATVQELVQKLQAFN